MRTSAWLILILGSLALGACERELGIDGVTWPCTEDSECGAGMACVASRCAPLGTVDEDATADDITDTSTSPEDTTSGDTADSTPPPPRCGDGHPDEELPQPEVCDDGGRCDDDSYCTADAQCAARGAGRCTTRNGDGCSADCRSTERCGDGVLNDYAPYHETCDVGGRCANGIECTRDDACAGSGDELCVPRPSDGCASDCRSQSSCTTEVCDGVDNDCDDDADEGFVYAGSALGEPCDGVGACGAGVVQCASDDSSRATCSTNPDGTSSQAISEVCNGHDDDCDGDTDEGAADDDGDSLADCVDPDDDDDGRADGVDACPTGQVGWVSGGTTDHDADGCRDSDEDADDDNDAIPDVSDNCPKGRLGWTAGPSNDHDLDGCLDLPANLDEDADDDGDGVPDVADECPRGDKGWIATKGTVAVPGTDWDQDGCRDAGEDQDDDDDGLSDAADLCDPDAGGGGDRGAQGSAVGWARTVGTAQAPGTDWDSDGCQDAGEDDDDDQDGVLDALDRCDPDAGQAPDLGVQGSAKAWSPTVGTAQAPGSDWDADGCRDADEDADDDNDGRVDVDDQCDPDATGDAGAAGSAKGWARTIGTSVSPGSDWDDDGCRDADEDVDDDDDELVDAVDLCDPDTSGAGDRGAQGSVVGWSRTVGTAQAPGTDWDADGCQDAGEDDDDDQDGVLDGVDRCDPDAGQAPDLGVLGSAKGWSPSVGTAQAPGSDWDADGCRDADEDADDDDDGRADVEDDCDPDADDAGALGSAKGWTRTIGTAGAPGTDWDDDGCRDADEDLDDDGDGLADVDDMCARGAKSWARSPGTASGDGADYDDDGCRDTDEDADDDQDGKPDVADACDPDAGAAPDSGVAASVIGWTPRAGVVGQPDADYDDDGCRDDDEDGDDDRDGEPDGADACDPDVDDGSEVASAVGWMRSVGTAEAPGTDWDDDGCRDADEDADDDDDGLMDVDDRCDPDAAGGADLGGRGSARTWARTKGTTGAPGSDWDEDGCRDADEDDDDDDDGKVDASDRCDPDAGSAPDGGAQGSAIGWARAVGAATGASADFDDDGCRDADEDVDDDGDGQDDGQDGCDPDPEGGALASVKAWTRNVGAVSGSNADYDDDGCRDADEDQDDDGDGRLDGADACDPDASGPAHDGGVNASAKAWTRTVGTVDEPGSDWDDDGCRDADEDVDDDDDGKADAVDRCDPDASGPAGDSGPSGSAKGWTSAIGSTQSPGTDWDADGCRDADEDADDDDDGKADAVDRCDPDASGAADGGAVGSAKGWARTIGTSVSPGSDWDDDGCRDVDEDVDDDADGKDDAVDLCDPDAGQAPDLGAQGSATGWARAVGELSGESADYDDDGCRDADEDVDDDADGLADGADRCDPDALGEDDPELASERGWTRDSSTPCQGGSDFDGDGCRDVAEDDDDDADGVPDPPSWCCGADVDCDDGVACTVDTCAVSTGDCANAPDDGACAGLDTDCAEGVCTATGCDVVPVTLPERPGGSVLVLGSSEFGQTNVPTGLVDVVSVSAGHGHAVALRSNGTVVAWGNNDSGQASVPPDLPPIRAIDAGTGHTLALTTDGRVIGWGDSSALVPAGLPEIVDIAAGHLTSFAVAIDGEVYGWGAPGYTTWIVPEGLSDVVAVDAGDSHALALTSDGTVVAWGSNSAGQTTVPSNLVDVVAVEAGWSTSWAIRADGTWVSWGHSQHDDLDSYQLTHVRTLAIELNAQVAITPEGDIVGWYAWAGGNSFSLPDLGDIVSVDAGSGWMIVATAPECDDGSACTTGDTCVELACVGAARDCDDGQACTLDACVESTGQCSHERDPELCCGDADCDDGVACTVDRCALDMGLCANTLDDANCDDLDGKCRSGTCTVTGCVATPLEGACDDGDACTGHDACVAGECLGDPYRRDISAGCGADALVTVTFTGHVVEVHEEHWSPGASYLDDHGIGIGTPFSGTYTFRNGQVDGLPADETVGHYTSATADSGMMVALGDASLGASGKLWVVIGDDRAEYGMDRFDSYWISPDWIEDGQGHYELQLSALDRTGTALTSDALWTGVPDLATWQQDPPWTGRSFLFAGDPSGTGGSLYVLGELDMLTSSCGVTFDPQAPVVQLETVTAQVASTGGATVVTVTSPACPAGTTLVSGGCEPSSADLHLLASSQTWTGDAPAPSWTCRARDLRAGGSPAVTMSAHAYCSDDLPATYRSAASSLALAPHTSHTAEVACPEGQRPMSGGCDVDVVSPDLALVRMGPDELHPGRWSCTWRWRGAAALTSGTAHARAACTDAPVYTDSAYATYGGTLSGDTITPPIGVGCAGDGVAVSGTCTVGDDQSLYAGFLSGDDWACGTADRRAPGSPAQAFRRIVHCVAALCPAVETRHELVGWGNAATTPIAAPYALSVVDAGVGHIVGLSGDRLVAWSINLETDELGQAELPADNRGFADVTAGYRHTVALHEDGTVEAWGDDGLGQLDVPLGLAEVIDVQAGWDHTLALRADGSIVAWGDNAKGQTTVPGAASGATQISAGGEHSLALVAGSVVAWGSDDQGQTTVPGAAADGQVVAIAAGYRHSLAVRGDGAVVAWGSNTYGERTVPGGLTGVVAVAAGDGFSLALRADRTIVGWGDDSYGQVSRLPTSASVDRIAAGPHTALFWSLSGEARSVGWQVLPTGYVALTDDPSSCFDAGESFVVAACGAEVWGKNASGVAYPPSGHTFVKVTAGPDYVLGLKEDGTVIAWGGLAATLLKPPTNLVALDIAAGETHALAIVGADRHVVAWGSNSFGESTVPPGLTGIEAISAGFAGSLALRADGTVVYWGQPATGNQSIPAGLDDVEAIAEGGGFALALREGGSVVAWGLNTVGQGSPPPANTGPFVAIDTGTGGAHSLAIDEAGQVVAWGDNSEGQCDVPPDVEGAYAIAAGFGYSLAKVARTRQVSPRIEALTPLAVRHGEVIHVFGRGFVDTFAVLVDQRPASWRVVSGRVLEVTVPASASVGAGRGVTVFTRGGVTGNGPVEILAP
ncbi:MAG: hypothetical protein IT385_06090 [Deltaproteobacteria bacterium]|nr:hypothetical protein [Deltaproteobacteria bacterium]